MSKPIDVQAIAEKTRSRLSGDELSFVEDLLADDLRTLALALAVRDARTAAGLTQAQLSVVSGITQAEISRIESAKFSPRVSTLFKLADALKTTFAIGATLPAAADKPLATVSN